MQLLDMHLLDMAPTIGYSAPAGPEAAARVLP
jgi:hypothetical protein